MSPIHTINKTIYHNQQLETVKVNIAESPISFLYYKKDKQGQPFLTEEEFLAAERLRVDFTYANLHPKVTANYSAVSVKGYNPHADVQLYAIDSARKLYKALDYVGVGLKDVVFRVCCFLEGLESVEKQLQLPSRSGKIVLKIALQRLAEFYNKTTTNKKPSRA